MFDLYTNFDVIFLANLTDKIHYQIFDSLGRIVQVLVDNDGKTSTGVSRTDNEGSPVAGIDQVLAYSYNVKGEVTEMKRDNNVDGKYDYREAYTLNANGNWIAKQVDLTNDGTFDRKEVYTKEADDGLVETKFYNVIGEASKEVLTQIEHYELNTNNHRTKVSVDIQGNKTINSIIKYDVDAYGRASKAYFDMNGDNNANRIETYTRNANGYTEKTEISTTADGSVESTIKYTYDAQGNVLKESTYSTNLDKADQTIRYTYDEYNRIVKTATDNTGDGVADKIKVSTYNELGRETSSIEYTGLSDGTIESAQRTITNIKTYDDYDNASITVVKYSFNPAGNVTATRTYNSSNLVETVHFEFENGKTAPYSNRYEYNYEHLPNSFSHIYAYNANNVLTAKSQIFYDDLGNTQYTLRDAGGDGTVERLLYGNTGQSLSKNTHLDLTSWSEEKLAELGTSLENIAFSNRESIVIDELTINADIVARISNGGLRIGNGHQEGDAVHLSGFKQASSSDMQGFKLYTATVGDEDLNLYIQNSIEVNIIGG